MRARVGTVAIANLAATVSEISSLCSLCSPFLFFGEDEGRTGQWRGMQAMHAGLSSRRLPFSSELSPDQRTLRGVWIRVRAAGHRSQLSV